MIPEDVDIIFPNESAGFFYIFVELLLVGFRYALVADSRNIRSIIRFGE